MTTRTQITNIAHKLDLTDYAGDFIDDYDMAERIDVAAIFERHDRTAQLLPAVVAATQAVALAERQRIVAIRAAKDSGRFTVDEIARTAGITRDGVYKMLNRADLAETFETGFAQMRENSAAVGKALADTLNRIKDDAEKTGHAIGQWISDKSG